MNEPKTYESIFNMKTIAVVSMSPKPERPSHFVALYMPLFQSIRDKMKLLVKHAIHH